MALPSSIISGQSNAPAFSSVPQQFPLIGFPSNNSADRVIEERIGTKTIKNYTFPGDKAKYHFRIIENEWHFASTRLTAEKIYNLSFPRELMDKNEVNYNSNFSYLSALGRIMGSYATNASSAIGGVVSSVSGLKLNTLKSVTLEVPDFKTHQLTWTLSPKTYNEAVEIQKIIFSLKKGMTPKGIGSQRFATVVLQFPKIYNLYFSPNSEWLFKFKPCVLTSIAVDYTGGTQVPSFFENSRSGGGNPPESITIATNWLELEYWVQEDFKSNFNGDVDIPSSDPLDAASWYGYPIQVEPMSAADFQTINPTQSYGGGA